jgi:D-alanyl-D-alanine carboxypeptidase
MRIRISFATSLTLALFTTAYAQTLDKAKLDQFFDRLAEKNKAMGSLAIVKDGNVLYARAIGYGQVNGTEKKPLTAASRFRIGSITKMFTATMIEGAAVFTFDAAKNQMTIKRRGGERVFTKVK